MIIISLILAIIVGALMAGGMILADRIGFYLIILIPIIAGTAIGFAVALPYFNRRAPSATTVNPTIGGGLADVVVRDNRPGRLPLIIASLIGTIVAVGVYWGGSYVVTINEIYQSDRADFLSEVTADDPTMTEENAQALLDDYLVEETGSPGLIGYIKIMQEDLSITQFVEILADEGISINRTGSSSTGGINLQGTLAYIYWGVEILLIFGFAVATALRRARGEAAPAATEPAVATE